MNPCILSTLTPPWSIAIPAQQVLEVSPDGEGDAPLDVVDLYHRLCGVPAPADARLVRVDDDRWLRLGARLQVLPDEPPGLLPIPRWLRGWSALTGVRRVLSRGEDVWLFLDIPTLLAGLTSKA